MKKILIFVWLILILSGCSSINERNESSNTDLSGDMNKKVVNVNLTGKVNSWVLTDDKISKEEMKEVEDLIDSVFK